MEILEVRDLDYSYQDGDSKRIIFEKASVVFDEGVFYSILGESGSGKTTFLSVIAGQDNRYQGEVLFKGEEIKKIGLDKYRRTGVSMIYQNYNLIPHLSALENVFIAMDISENVRQINRNEVEKLLEEIGITKDKMSRKSSSLSGGEQQRVAIARSIETDSKIIVADEPTGNLDWKASEEVMELFKKMAHENNKCVIMVTHNEKLAQQTDVIYRIDQVNHKMVREVKVPEACVISHESLLRNVNKVRELHEKGSIIIVVSVEDKYPEICSSLGFRANVIVNNGGKVYYQDGDIKTNAVSTSLFKRLSEAISKRNLPVLVTAEHDGSVYSSVAEERQLPFSELADDAEITQITVTSEKASSEKLLELLNIIKIPVKKEVTGNGRIDIVSIDADVTGEIREICLKNGVRYDDVCYLENQIS